MASFPRTIGMVGAFLLVAAGTAAPAAARPPAPRPILVTDGKATNPDALTWLTADGRKALAGAIASLKAGTMGAFVFAAFPGVDAWATRSTSKPSDFASVEDLARAALQSCQFFAKAPCFIVSINGEDARDQFGGYPVQPDLLRWQSGGFRAGRIPFLLATDQATAGGYASATDPKAFVVTVTQYWAWRTGKTVFDAIAAAYGACQKNAPGQVCILYAVNNHVVFEPAHN